MDRDSPVSPHWAPRLRKRLIERLYQQDARGIVDRELIEEVGYGLLARCQSILMATEAARGHVACAACESVIPRAVDQEALNCLECGWQGTWGAYQKSYRHKQLVAGGMEDFFREYARDFPAARTAQRQMILIDTLLHRYHCEAVTEPSRPGATNLIEGKMTDIVEFLHALSYGDASTPELVRNRAEWGEKLERSWVSDYLRARAEGGRSR